MTNKRRFWLSKNFLALVSVSVWLVPAALQAESVVEDYMEQVRNTTGAPGISVAVAVKGEIVFSKGVGYAELENRTPATGSTVHNVGSVSKVLATVAVMQLVESGKVGLDDVIQKYVPTFPASSPHTCSDSQSPNSPAATGCRA